MFGKSTETYRNWEKEWSKYNNVPNDLDLINLGSTMAAFDFDYSLWTANGKEGFNFASSPQTLYYDKQVLEQYGGHLKKNGIVLICLAEYSLLVEKYNADDHNYKYYGYLEPERILNYSKKKAKLVKNNPARLDSKIAMEELKKNVKSILGMDNHSRAVDIYLDARQVMTGWKNEFGWNNEYTLTEEQQTTIRQTWGILQNIISYCKENEYRPVIVVLPFATYLRSLMPENILQQCLWKYIDKLKSNGIKVIDFWDDEYLQQHKFYETSLVLNEDGKKIFNNRVQQALYGTPLDESAKYENVVYDTMASNDKAVSSVKNFSRMGKTSKTYMLRNGLEIPWISYGTGVIWKYTRNPRLFLKANAQEVALSVYHKNLNRELDGNLHIKKVLQNAYDSGFRMFDTGRIYAKSEKSLGNTVSSKDDVFITSKCSAMDVERQGSPNSVKGNLLVTLKNLKRDKLDLYLLHWPEGEHWLDYYEQIVKAYKAGWVRAFGACNLKMEHIKAIQDAGLELPMVIQEECHPFYSRADVRVFCKENGIQFEAHTPTMHMHPLVKDNDLLNALAKKYKKSVAQVILRWHYQNDVIPVCSTFSREHMEENLDIFDFELTDEEMDEIDGLNIDYICLNTTGIDDPNYIYND